MGIIFILGMQRTFALRPYTRMQKQALQCTFMKRHDSFCCYNAHTISNSYDSAEEGTLLPCRGNVWEASVHTNRFFHPFFISGSYPKNIYSHPHIHLVLHWCRRAINIDWQSCMHVPLDCPSHHIIIILVMIVDIKLTIFYDLTAAKQWNECESGSFHPLFNKSITIYFILIYFFVCNVHVSKVGKVGVGYCFSYGLNREENGWIINATTIEYVKWVSCNISSYMFNLNEG